MACGNFCWPAAAPRRADERRQEHAPRATREDDGYPFRLAVLDEAASVARHRHRRRRARTQPPAPLARPRPASFSRCAPGALRLRGARRPRRSGRSCRRCRTTTAAPPRRSSPAAPSSGSARSGRRTPCAPASSRSCSRFSPVGRQQPFQRVGIEAGTGQARPPSRSCRTTPWCRSSRSATCSLAFGRSSACCSAASVQGPLPRRPVAAAARRTGRRRLLAPGTCRPGRTAGPPCRCAGRAGCSRRPRRRGRRGPTPGSRLEPARHLVVQDEADVGLVDAEAERVGRHHHARPRRP